MAPFLRDLVPDWLLKLIKTAYSTMIWDEEAYWDSIAAEQADVENYWEARFGNRRVKVMKRRDQRWALKDQRRRARLVRIDEEEDEEEDEEIQPRVAGSKGRRPDDAASGPRR